MSVCPHVYMWPLPIMYWTSQYRHSPDMRAPQSQPYPLLVIPCGHHWRPVRTCSLDLTVQPPSPHRSPGHLTWRPTPSLPLPPLPLSYPDIRPGTYPPYWHLACMYPIGMLSCFLVYPIFEGNHKQILVFPNVGPCFRLLQPNSNSKEKDKKAKPSIYSNW